MTTQKLTGDLQPRETRGPSTHEVSSTILETQWDQFSRDGFLHLGQVLDGDAIDRLTARADDLAHGRIVNSAVQMQLDTGGTYDSLPEAVDSFEQGTRLYRKIQGLEFDETFSPLVRSPLFFEVCARMYGPQTPISIFRAMVMNKPAGLGTLLPWHQDGGDVWALDREPLVTIWIALDPATLRNGCMQAVRGSHRLGLLSQYGATVSEDDVAAHVRDEDIVSLEVPAGHAVLMHNWLVHRSGVNPSTVPRRAVTICYLDGRTRRTQTGELLPIVAGSVEPTPPVYVDYLQNELKTATRSGAESAEYAQSLEATLLEVRASQTQAEQYAQSLEADRARLENALAHAAPHENSSPAVTPGFTERVARGALRRIRAGAHKR